MTEIIQASSRNGLRYRLLLSVSSAAVLVLAGEARAEDADRPTVWIELGGAFDQISRGAVGWVPPNLTDPITNASPKPFGQAPGIGYDFDAAFGFAPDETGWVYTVSMRYGRALKGPTHAHDQAYGIQHYGAPDSDKYTLTNYAFVNATQQSHSTHVILDFTAGKDVGLGLFDRGRSTIHFGVRAAQLTERAEGTMTAFSTAPAKYSGGEVVHKADALFARSFTGAGPSVSWDGATPLMGSVNDGVTFDWGANAALLVGRQKAHISLHTSDLRYPGKYQDPVVLAQSTVTPDRDRTVVVPNLGGFAGISWRLPAGKVSMGYRADFFFGALDGGLTTARRNTNGFYGPFASVSIGLGG